MEVCKWIQWFGNKTVYFLHSRFGLSNKFDHEFPQGLAAKVSEEFCVYVYDMKLSRLCYYSPS